MKVGGELRSLRCSRPAVRDSLLLAFGLHQTPKQRMAASSNQNPDGSVATNQSLLPGEYPEARTHAVLVRREDTFSKVHLRSIIPSDGGRLIQ